MMAPNWSLPFDFMCNGSEFTMEAVLGQRINKVPHAIYSASRTLNDAQPNYSTNACQILYIWAPYFVLVNPSALLLSDILYSSMFLVFCRLLKETVANSINSWA